MAYPTIAAPYGMVPVKMLNGSPFNGAVRHYKIASGYAANIFNGDAVTLVTGGTVERDAADAAMTPIGVFLGCSYTDSTYGLTFSNHWPTGTVASDATAYVVDDVDVLFKMAVVTDGTTMGDLAQTDVGANAALVEWTAGGSTATGKAAFGVSDTSATTNTLPVRIVGLVEETTNSSGGYTEVYVKWNAGHQAASTTGV